MKLVDGTSSNGTYLGVIKPDIKNPENTILQYRLFYNKGYYHNSEYEQLKLKEPDLTSPVLWDDPKVSICSPEKIKNLESALTYIMQLVHFHLYIVMLILPTI